MNDERQQELMRQRKVGTVFISFVFAGMFLGIFGAMVLPFPIAFALLFGCWAWAGVYLVANT